MARNARPLVRLTPVTAIKPVRTPGIWAGKVMIAEHFDELPVDLQEMFGMIDSKPS